MTRYYNNEPALGFEGPIEIDGDQEMVATAEHLAKVWGMSTTAVLNHMREAFVPAVVIRRENGDYLARGEQGWIWSPIEELAEELPADRLGDLDVDDEVCPAFAFANSTCADDLDAGWGDEQGEVFARATLSSR